MSTISTFLKEDRSLEAVIGKHRLVLDVAESMGGKDRGPTSSELFVASLGSCIAAFVAGYCERTDIDARDLSVDVSFEQEEDPTRLVDLKIVINMPHADCGDRKDAILRVADHCPVHETVEYTMEAIDYEVHDRTSVT